MKSPVKIDFKEGNLASISLLLLPDTANTLYPSGNTDAQMVMDIERSLRKGDVIFDVGAYIGTSSLVFSKLLGKKGKVMAFEPNKFNRERMEKNFAINKELAKLIKISPLALSDKQGKINMVMSKNIDDGYSSTSRLEGAHSKIPTENLPTGFFESEVEVTTLDEFVISKNLIPKFIKVDIEGEEYKFLLGAKKTITKYSPIIYIEIHSEYCAIKVIQLLHSCGYIVSILYEELDGRIMIKAIRKSQVKKRSEEGKALLLEGISDSVLNANKEVSKVFNILSTHEEYKRSFENLSDQMIRGNDTIMEFLKEKISKLEDDKKKLSETVSSYEHSTSWRITQPLRNIAKVIRGILKQ